jgi:hypothetical protein
MTSSEESICAAARCVGTPSKWLLCRIDARTWKSLGVCAKCFPCYVLTITGGCCVVGCMTSMPKKHTLQIMNTRIAMCQACYNAEGGAEFFNTIQTMFEGIEPSHQHLVPWIKRWEYKKGAPFIPCSYGACCCPATFAIRGDKRQYVQFCNNHRLNLITAHNVNYRTKNPKVFRERRNNANRMRKVMSTSAYIYDLIKRRSERRENYKKIKEVKELHHKKIKLMIALSRNIIALKKENEQAQEQIAASDSL